MPVKLNDFTKAVDAFEQVRAKQDFIASAEGKPCLFLDKDGKPIVRTVSVVAPDAEQTAENRKVRTALLDILREKGCHQPKGLEGEEHLTLEAFHALLSEVKGNLTGAKIVLDGAALAATKLITQADVLNCFADEDREEHASLVNDAINGLAAAYKLRGDEIDDTTVGGLMTTVGHLSDLAGKLMNAYGSAPKGTGQREKIEKMADYCSARASELITLCAEAASKSETKAPAKDLESRTVRGLVADKAKTMHGADKFVTDLEKRTEELSKQVADLVLEYDNTLWHSKGYRAKVSALNGEVGAMITALDSQAKSAPPAEVTLVDALKAELQRLTAQLEILSCKPCDLIGEVKVQLIRDAFSVAKPLVTPAPDDILGALRSQGAKNALYVLFDVRSTDAKEKVEYRLDYAFELIKKLPNNVQNSTITPQQLMGVLSGRISAKKLTDIKILGVRDEDVDWSLANDRDVVSNGTIGEGGYNTVEETSHTIRKEGVNEEFTRECAFKGEVVAGKMMWNSPPGYFKSYDLNDARVYRMNRASYEAARFLKAESVIVKSGVGFHKGSVGIFMEKAKGDVPKSKSDGFRIKSRKAKGCLKRELNKLAWVDWLTGQCDRNQGNYLVHLDNDDAEVKGVDNDMSFPDYVVGLRKIKFSPMILIDLYGELLGKLEGEQAMFDTRAEPFEPSDEFIDEINRLINEYLGDVWVEEVSSDHLIKKVDGDPSRYEIDLGNSPELQDLFYGIFNASVLEKPRAITKSMYEQLMAVNAAASEGKTSLNEAARNFMGHGFTDAQYAATESRLREMIVHAAKLGNEGGVIEDDASERWEKTHEPGGYYNRHVSKERSKVDMI